MAPLLPNTRPRTSSQVFNGFIITYPDMPSGWRWMNRAVPPTWILYGLGVSQLGNDDGELIYGGTVGQRYDVYDVWYILLSCPPWAAKASRCVCNHQTRQEDSGRGERGEGGRGCDI